MSQELLTTVTTFWPFVVMGLMFYFLLYRPQKTEQKKRSEMLDSLKEGTKVITIGGILGETTKVHDDKLTLKIADHVEIKVIKGAVGHLQGAPAVKK